MWKLEPHFSLHSTLSDKQPAVADGLQKIKLWYFPTADVLGKKGSRYEGKEEGKEEENEGGREGREGRRKGGRKRGRQEGRKSQSLRCDFQLKVDQGWGEAILWPHSEQGCHYGSDSEWRRGVKLKWWAKMQGERGGEGQDTEALSMPSFSRSLSSEDRDTAEVLALPALGHR